MAMRHILWPTIVLSGVLLATAPAPAEYGDVALNRFSEKAGVRPVLFPHWFHRIRFRCKVCHQDLGMTMRAGANDLRMAGLAEGRFCGACHNNAVAWGLEQCNLCHAGKSGLRTGIVNRR